MVKKKRLNKKGKTLLSLLIIIFIGIVSFIILNINLNNDKKIEKPSKEEQKEEKKEVVEEKLKILDLESNTRPYAVMINNISVARPLQSGLQDAYIIYEIIVEVD